MIGLVQSAVLFTRGAESVRIVRVTRADGRARLYVHGPGPDETMYVLEDAIECLWAQVDTERRLQAQGFARAAVPDADRRSGRERRLTSRGADRRRVEARQEFWR